MDGGQQQNNNDGCIRYLFFFFGFLEHNSILLFLLLVLTSTMNHSSKAIVSLLRRGSGRCAAKNPWSSFSIIGSGCNVKASPLSRSILSAGPSNGFFSTSASDESDNSVLVSIEEAQSTTAKALQQIGWDADDASIQAEIMTAAEVCGNNQGLVKMYDPTMMVPAKNAGKPTIERLTSNSAVVNANQAPGMLGAVTAADQAVKLLQDHPQHAISIVTW
jgi:hypothetical protein